VKGLVLRAAGRDLSSIEVDMVWRRWWARGEREARPLKSCRRTGSRSRAAPRSPCAKGMTPSACHLASHRSRKREREQ
jgi:hypothetical protein